MPKDVGTHSPRCSQQQSTRRTPCFTTVTTRPTKPSSASSPLIYRPSQTKPHRHNQIHRHDYGRSQLPAWSKLTLRSDCRELFGTDQGTTGTTRLEDRRLRRHLVRSSQQGCAWMAWPSYRDIGTTVRECGDGTLARTHARPPRAGGAQAPRVLQLPGHGTTCRRTVDHHQEDEPTDRQRNGRHDPRHRYDSHRLAVHSSNMGTATSLPLLGDACNSDRHITTHGCAHIKSASICAALEGV